MLMSVMHSTSYRYADPVSRSTQYIRLTPPNTERQRVVSWELVLPAPAITMGDAFGNITHVLTLDRPHQELELRAGGQVEVDQSDEGEPAGPINPRVFLTATALTEPSDAIREFVAPMRALVQSRPLIGSLDLMNAVLERMPYQAGVTSVDSTAAQAFDARRGVVQDHAHVFVTCCRLLGLPARYVSGYAYSPNREQVASHAWAEAWLSNRWISFDIMNAAQASGNHIKLAVGRDYMDACPVRGVRLGGGKEVLSATAQVHPSAGQRE